MALLAVLLPNTTQASSLTVPDNVATIQAALDAGVDSVFVRAGIYAETPTMGKRVSLLGFPGEPRPVLSGLIFNTDGGSSDPVVHIVGVEFETRVEGIPNYSSELPMVLFEDCHLKAGFREISGEIGGSRVFRRCRIDGAIVYGDGSALTVDSCDVQGVVSASHWDCQLTVMHSRFRGPGISGNVGYAHVSENVLEQGSIVVNADFRGPVIEDNLLSSGQISVQSEDGDARVARNHLDDGGIYAGAAGLVLEENVVLNSGGIGIFASVRWNATITRNLVSGSGDHGFYIAGSDPDRIEVTNNTSVFNHGCGFLSECSSQYGPYTFTGNIGAMNGAHGVRWGLPEVTTFRFNNWFDNALGDVQGLPPSALDLTVDPIFCDAENGDFRLAAASPLVNAAGYGRIGALGIGCYAPGVVENAFHLIRVGPNPASGPVNIDFEMPRAATIEVDVFDILGRRMASPARGNWPAGKHSVAWTPRSGQAGVYLVRYRFPGGEERRRLVRTP